MCPNCLPRRKNPGCKSPYEMLRGKPPDFKYVKPFGRLMYVYNFDHSQGWRLEPRGMSFGRGEQEGRKTWIGYDLNTKGIYHADMAWLDEAFFPKRPLDSQRITSCDFASYPKAAQEEAIIQMYSFSTESDPVQTPDGATLSLAKVKEELGLQGKWGEVWGYDPITDRYCIKTDDRYEWLDSGEFLQKIEEGNNRSLPHLQNAEIKGIAQEDGDKVMKTSAGDFDLEDLQGKLLELYKMRPGKSWKRLSCIEKYFVKQLRTKNLENGS